MSGGSGLPVSLPVTLVGQRCSGKSTSGRALAKALGVGFVDLDDALVELAQAGFGRTAGELFEELGEPAFRGLEARALAQLLGQETPSFGVLATGGGAVLDAGSRELLRQRSICVWLRAEPDRLAERLIADGTLRPSLTGAPPAEEMAAVADQRRALYAEVAQHVLDVDDLDPDQVLLELQALLAE
ncbi:MAG: shikimate kinase [Planctomycetota bacterium]|jgi:shikimate kinase